MRMIIGTAVFMFLNSNGAFSAPKCTEKPKSEWMAKEKAKEKIIALGYTVDKFDIEGTCYEVKGKNKAGEKIESYFDPITAKLVKEKKN